MDLLNITEADMLRMALDMARTMRTWHEGETSRLTDVISDLNERLWKAEHGDETPPPDLNADEIPF